MIADDSRFVFVDGPTGRTIPVYVHRPDKVSASAPIIMALHGISRRAEAILDDWRLPAERHGLLLIVPHFTEEEFPGAGAYQLGNLFPESGAREPTSPELRSYAILDRIFEKVASSAASPRTNYSLYGHSAGSQFAHRLLLLQSTTRASLVVSANAGFYLLPDREEPWPTGLGGTGESIGDGDIARWLASPLVLLLGDHDLDDNFASTNPAAARQGANRLERGRNYYERCKRYAGERSLPFAWSIEEVPGVGHDDAGMAPRAAEIIAEKMRAMPG